MHIVTVAAIAIMASATFNRFLQFSQRYLKTLRQTEQKSFLGHAHTKKFPHINNSLNHVCMCVGVFVWVCVCVLSVLISFHPRLIFVTNVWVVIP